MTAAAKQHSDTDDGDRLARLPDAVLVQIFQVIAKHSRRDLCNISLLNRRYHLLADAILYNVVQFLTPELHQIFTQSLRRNPRRGSAIYEIQLAYPASKLSSQYPETPIKTNHWNRPLDNLSQSIATMSNLEVLDIAVPDTLLHGIGQLFDGPFDLACLQSCTLFYQSEGDAFWDLRENIHIFSQPSLEKLTIKRAKLDHRGFDLLEQPHNTALAKLHLLECDINDDALGDLLAFPKALKEFVMTQPQDPSPDLEESSDSLRDYTVALGAAAHSLETITIDFPILRNTKALAMRDFVELKTLRINWDHQLFGKSSKKPRMTSVGVPPELETLEFFNPLGTDEEVTDLFVSAVESIHITARKLAQLVLVEGGDDGQTIPNRLHDALKAQPQIKIDVIGQMDIHGE